MPFPLAWFDRLKTMRNSKLGSIRKSDSLKSNLTGSKKKLDLPLEHKRLLVEAQHPDISQRRQCQLLGVNRAGLYYQAVEESPENLQLMRLLDQQYTRYPFYGVTKMTQWLRTQHY